MSDLDDKLLLELADESRREFLKKLGKGLAVATSGIKPDLSAAKKVAKVSNYVHRDAKFDAYDALNYALDNMFEFGRAASDLSMPLDLQQRIGNKLQHMIIGHKYYAVPGGPSSLRPTDYDFYSSLIDNAEDYGDMEEAIASSSATLQDVFDYPKIFKGADNIWKEKGRAGLEDIEDYIKNNVEGYIEADNEGETSYEGEPEPVDEDPRDYLERDYASGPHMNSFKPEMSFKDFYLTEGRPMMQLDDEKIKQLHAAGNSSRNIGKELGVSSQTILARLNAMGIVHRHQPAGKYELDDEKIKQLYATGFTTTDIGKQIGVSQNTIINRLKAMGVERRPAVMQKLHQLPAGHPRKLDDEKIKQLYAAGYSMGDIGKELGVNHMTIHSRLKAMGIERRPRGPAGFKRGSDLRNPSQMRTRNITGPGNVGGDHQTFPGSSQTVKTNLPGPRRGKGH